MNLNNFKNGIKWGIIGVGDVCEVKSGPAFNRVEGSELVAVMRRNAEKAADFAKRHGVPKWYDDADALINDPDVNAIYIATPPNLHEYYTLKVAAAGKPVYVEKPMARTYQECQNMIDACQKAKVPLFVAFYRRSLPMYLKVKEIIDSGELGDIRLVDIRLMKPTKPDIVWAAGNEDNWRILPEISGGGYFYDLASHQLDLLDFFFGKIVSAHGIAKNQSGQYPAEDIVLGTFHFENGVMGQGTWCFNAPPNAALEKTTIYGSKGYVAFTYFSDFHIELQIDGQEKAIMPFEMPKHIQEPHIQGIVNELRGIGTCPCKGEDGARTGWVLDEICRRIDK